MINKLEIYFKKAVSNLNGRDDNNLFQILESDVLYTETKQYGRIIVDIYNVDAADLLVEIGEKNSVLDMENKIVATIRAFVNSQLKRKVEEEEEVDKWISDYIMKCEAEDDVLAGRIIF